MKCKTHNYENYTSTKKPTPFASALTIPPSSNPEEVAPGVVLDYNESNQVVGIEMLYLSKRSPNLNLSTLELVTA